ncbi:hypothetical protein Esti_006803 [Eimeria stiedai]
MAARRGGPKPLKKQLERLLRHSAFAAAKATTAEAVKRLPLLEGGRAAFACKGLECAVFETSNTYLQQQQQRGENGEEHQQQQQRHQQHSEDCGLMQQLFNLTKKNMQQLYDASNFMNVGWRDASKMEELASPEAFFWIVFSGSPATLEDAASSPLVAFLHFRFEVEECEPVVYLYELQTHAEYQSRSVGRRLLLMLELRLRKLNEDLQQLRFDAKTSKLKPAPPAATAAEAAAADPMLLPVQLKKIMCTVLRRNPRAMSFYKVKCRFTSDESCPYWQQQQLAAAGAGSSEKHEAPPEYEILKRDLAELRLSSKPS